MNNQTLADKLSALFPVDDINLRIALVSVLKAVLQNQVYDPDKKLVFSLRGFKNLPDFEKELLNQPLLMDTLFPGKTPQEIKREFKDLTSADNPSMDDIYSMIVKNISLGDLNKHNTQYSNENLRSISESISDPSKREFIWQLLNQEDTHEIVQQIDRTLAARSALSMSSDHSEDKTSELAIDSDISTEDVQYEYASVSDITDDLYSAKSSSLSPVHHTSVPGPDASTPPEIHNLIKMGGRVSEQDLVLLVYSGLNQKVTQKKAQNSIDTLRFIYTELQKEPNERIYAFQLITDKDKTSERHICDMIVGKLQRYYHTGVTDKKTPKEDPRHPYSQRFKAKLASMQDNNQTQSTNEDDSTHVSEYKKRR